jgi:hypothetical protein
MNGVQLSEHVADLLGTPTYRTVGSAAEFWCCDCGTNIDPDTVCVDEEGRHHLYECDRPVAYHSDQAAEYRHDVEAYDAEGVTV